MRVVEINGGVFGSTGKIMFHLSDMLTESGAEVLCFSPVTKTNRFQEPEHHYIKIGSYFSRCVCVAVDRITGAEGTSAVVQTANMLRKISSFKPDIIHLHSIHGSFVSIPMLFSYIKKHRIKLIWTLHDCWSFTGHCPHYARVNCVKWREGCYGCELYREYPKTLFDNSRYMWKMKKRWFAGVQDAVLVAPSHWMAEQVKESFLNRYSCRVIHNGIDLSIFRPVQSDFRERYGILGKFVILGVAFGWNAAKGLDTFIHMAKTLPECCQVVMVGTDACVDKQLPPNIISIPMTQNQDELAEIYSVADVFVNATRQDTFPTVNMEALACGTPVLTYNVGGSPEIIDETCGMCVEKDDADELCRKILEIRENNSFSQMNCVNRARRLYDQHEKYREYLDLFSAVSAGLTETSK